MSVYVDDMRASYGRMVMCHMLADSHEELVAMADALGVQRRWIQHESTYKEHFDISLTKRALAVQHGAIEIPWKEAGKIIAVRRKLLSRTDAGSRSPAKCHIPQEGPLAAFVARASLPPFPLHSLGVDPVALRNAGSAGPLQWCMPRLRLAYSPPL